MRRSNSPLSPSESLLCQDSSPLFGGGAVLAPPVLSSSLVRLETPVREEPPESHPALPAKATPSTSASGHYHHLNGAYMMTPASEIEKAFRHRHWADKREHLRCTIACLPLTANRLERWGACGAEANVFWDKSATRPDGSGGRLLVACLHCHDRFCWPCARARSATIARNLHEAMQTKTTRFLTLTLAANHASLSDQIDRIYRSFRTLRADPWWKSRVSGSATFLEITLNPTTLLWHPHLHPVCGGEFLPQEVLSRKWHAITGDSPIVHIKAVPKPAAIANYVCKYASKAMDASVFEDDDKLLELVHSLGGRRLCLTTGSWTKLQLTAKPKTLDYGSMKHLGKLNKIVNDAAAGEPYARTLLSNLQRDCTFADLRPEMDEEEKIDREMYGDR